VHCNEVALIGRAMLVRFSFKDAPELCEQPVFELY
jgi:hypothetical protein